MSNKSVISEDTNFTGNLNIDHPLHINGIFDGEIISSSDIVVGKLGLIKGSVKCNNITVYGKTEGIIECFNEMTIIPGGSIIGEITTKNMNMQPGSILKGSLKMCV